MAETINPFAFIARLPEATITDEFVKSEGVNIRATLVEGPGRNVVIEAIYGDNVPAPVYTVNVGGRGSLVIGETEFRDLVSAGLAMFEGKQSGFAFGVTPTSAALTEIDLPDLPDFLSAKSAD